MSGQDGEKTGKTYACWSGTFQWQIVHTHRCSDFIGIRGMKNSSNHMRDLTRITAAISKEPCGRSRPVVEEQRLDAPL